MQRQLIIIGAGGHGSEVYAYTRELAPELRVAGVVDEFQPPGPWWDTQLLGDFGKLEAFLAAHPDELFHYITAAGANALRRRLVAQVEALRCPNLSAASVVHPRASIGCDVEIGAGTCLAPGSIVTTRVRMGEHCILNVNASVSHDCVVGAFTNINPGAVVCGSVRLGTGCYVGAGATILEKRTIGDDVIIGAGAVVTRDLPAGVTAVGVPARVIKHAPTVAVS